MTCLLPILRVYRRRGRELPGDAFKYLSMCRIWLLPCRKYCRSDLRPSKFMEVKQQHQLTNLKRHSMKDPHPVHPLQVLIPIDLHFQLILYQTW